jgi:hypothetical protein
MKLQLVKPSAAVTIGLFLTAPTAYFIFVSFLKYVFGLPALFDAIEPLLNSMGAKETLGWNINLLILFGPLLAFVVNVTSILSFHWNKDEDVIHIHVSILKRIMNWVVIGISAGSLALLFLYALGENCNC